MLSYLETFIAAKVIPEGISIIMRFPEYDILWIGSLDPSKIQFDYDPDKRVAQNYIRYQ